MWTRTLSTTISTRPSAMGGLSHGGRAERPRPAATEDESGERAGDEAADVGEEGDAALRIARPERRRAVDELEDEPEAEHEQRRHLDELVEEAEEHQRQDPCPRIDHEVRPERGRNRPRRADQRHRRPGRDRNLGRGCGHAARQVKDEKQRPPHAVLDVVAEDPEIEHVPEQVEPAAVQEHARDHAEHRRGGDVPGPQRRGDVRRHDAVLGDEPVEPGLATAREHAELPRERHEAGDDEGERDDRCSPRRVRVPKRDHGAADAPADAPGFVDGRLEPAAPDGAGDPPGSGEAAARNAWWTVLAVTQTSVAGASFTPGMTYIPRTSSRPLGSPAMRYWARYLPSALSSATTRLFAAS